MYTVLYRKYRPRFFADVIGQQAVTDTLRNELKTNRIAHAYLFTGSRGTGKTTCSKILAKAVNCLDPQDGDPCGKCEVCRGIDDGSIMDVVEIDAASNNGVDDVRTLREEAGFTPANTRYRVYIIDEVHMLSIGAFNALLKTLEEPAPHVIFILATTEVHKLPATILSRCQRFDFHRIAPEDIAERLSLVCEQEGVTIEHNAALLLAGIADGAMRDALSLLDRCISVAEDKIDEDTVRRVAGLADNSSIFHLTDCILESDCAEAVNTVGALYKESKDMARLCEELVHHFRNIMLVKSVKNARDMIVMSASDFDRLTVQADKTDLRFILSTISALLSAHEKMLRGADRRIEMEMTLVGIIMTGKNDALPENLEKRLTMLERAVEQLTEMPESIKQVPKPRESTGYSPPINRPSKENMEQLRAEAVPMPEWPEIIEDIKKYSKTVGAGFDGSRAYVSGKYVLVDSSNDICFELLRKPAQRDRMRASIKRITGKEYKLGRYSYPDEKKTDDALSELMSELKSAGVPVDDKNNTNQ